MKNPHLFNRLLNWFACFGSFDEELTEESILESLHELHGQVDKAAQRHADFDCRQKLSATTLLIILAIHHMQNPKNHQYSDAKDTIRDARINLYDLQHDKERSHSACRSDHSFFSLHKEMRNITESIDKLSVLDDEQELTSTTVMTASMS